MKKLLTYLESFSKTRVLVIGDVMVDRYIWGRVIRISPEAPVPVVDVTKESTHPGGAANVFTNIAALEGMADLCGVLGNDSSGHWLIEEFKKSPEEVSGLVVEINRPTSEKTRIVAHNQHVVRFDREMRDPISAKTQQKLFDFVSKKLESSTEKPSCVVLSDYAKGVLTQGLTKDLLHLCKKQGVKVVADPKVRHMDYYREVTLVTPNHLEASEASGVDIRDEYSLIEAGKRLLQRLQCQALLITRGEQGMSLFEQDGGITHIPTMAREVFDVTGAGDTVIGTLALALGAGAPLKDAAMLANYAAGIVVGVVGTATASRDALRHAIAESQSQE